MISYKDCETDVEKSFEFIFDKKRLIHKDYSDRLLNLDSLLLTPKYDH